MTMRRQPTSTDLGSTRCAGFTLIEILVVVLIMTVLATIVGVRVIPQLGKAKVAAAVAQIKNLQNGLRLYRMDNGAYPTREQGLAALCEIPTVEPIPVSYPDLGYLDSRKLPRDPWGNEFVYMVPGPDREAYEIVTYGSDGEPDGEGEASDISSADL